MRTRRRQHDGTNARNTLRYLAVAIPAIVAVLVLVAWVLGRMANLSAEVDTNREVIDVLVADGETVQQQLRELDVEPAAPPPQERVEGLPGPVGATGAVGPQGPLGPRGPQGLPGLPGLDGLPGGVGPAGPAGAQGDVGTAGEPGAQGPQGEPGPAGPEGPAGATGATGQPPLSWTFTFPDGKLHICVRTDPFDPTAPTYICTSEPQPED